MQIGIQQPLVDQFLDLKKKYLVAHHAEKQTLRSQVDKLRHEIMGFSNREADGFDWVIDFAEVFSVGGFDVVIANPPYVSARSLLQGQGREYKDHLSRRYASAVGLYDLYVVFWELALQSQM